MIGGLRYPAIIWLISQCELDTWSSHTSFKHMSHIPNMYFWDCYDQKQDKCSMKMQQKHIFAISICLNNNNKILHKKVVNKFVFITEQHLEWLCHWKWYLDVQSCCGLVIFKFSSFGGVYIGIAKMTLISNWYMGLLLWVLPLFSCISPCLN